MKIQPIQIETHEHRQNWVSRLHRMINEIMARNACYYSTRKGADM
jgi:hypothetical protein